MDRYGMQITREILLSGIFYLGNTVITTELFFVFCYDVLVQRSVKLIPKHISTRSDRPRLLNIYEQPLFSNLLPKI